MVHYKKLTFTNSHGVELAGMIELPKGEIKAYGIMAHCFACSKDILAAVRISRALSLRGIAVLRFDFMGIGDSQGEFAKSTFSSNVADILCAADYLRTHYQAPKLLVGHSLGGAAAIKAAEEIPEIQALSTIGAPSDPAHVSQHFADHMDEIIRDGHATVMLAGKQRTITKDFVQDLEHHDIAKSLSKLHRKGVLIFHSPNDNIVKISHAAILYKAARHPKSFVSLDRATHLVADKKDADYVANVIAAWGERYICQSNA